LEEDNVEIEILREGEDLEGYEREIFKVIKKSAKDGKVVELGESVKNYSGSLDQQEAKEYKRSVLDVIKDKIYDSLIRKGYFKESPKETRRTYIELGTSMFFIGFGITLAYACLKYGMLGYVSAFLLLTVFLIIISLFSLHIGVTGFFIGLAIGSFYCADYLSQYGEIAYIVGILFYLFIITILSLIAFGLIVYLIRSLLVRFFNFAITPISITNTEDWEISFPTILYISVPIFILTVFIPSLISNDNRDKNVGILTILKDILQSPFVNLALGILLSGIIIYFIGQYMAKKTKKGVEMYKRILGFKEFLERVEESRLKRMMEEDPTKLERMLPYAIDLVNYVQSWIHFVEDIRDIGRVVSSLEASVNSLSEKIR
jgi:hypothetical protein